MHTLKARHLAIGLGLLIFGLYLFNTIIGGCGQVVTGGATTTTTTGGTTTTTVPGTATQTTTKEITAAAGGIISFSDGSSVSFPAGSLSTNQAITATVLGTSNFPAQVLGAVHVTSLEGLASPATVTLKFDPSQVGSGEDIVVGIVGGATSQETVSSAEVSVAEIVSPESIDLTKGLITVKTSHFSWVWAFGQERAYLVFDFLEYMYGVVKPGDILFVLTGAHGFRAGMWDASWMPGHVGLYEGTEESGALPGYQDVLESTVAKVATGKNGVQRTNSVAFRQLEHIFLGARRPIAYNLTDANRTYILVQARKMLGWPYDFIDFDNSGLPLGSGLLAGPTVGITCVGFVEKAYEDADLDPLVAALRQYLFFPIELFTKTKPVTDVAVRINQPIEFYVYGVVRNNYLTYSKWRTYLDQQNYYSISAQSSTLNLRTVTFPESNEVQVYSAGRTPHFVSKVSAGDISTGQTTYGHHVYPYFYWVPASTEVGGPYDVTFTLDAGANGKKTETINITVVK